MGKEKKTNKQSLQPTQSTDKASETGWKLTDIVLLSLSVVFIVIGMYEIMANGPSNGYWAVMMAMVCFFGYYIRKNK
jgi:hypothetical protein